MPYEVRKKKGGGATVTNTATGKTRQFAREQKAEDWMRIAEAVKHGWKPTGRPKTAARGRAR